MPGTNQLWLSAFYCFPNTWHLHVSLLGAFLLSLPLYACLPTSHTSCSFLPHAGPCPGMTIGLGPRFQKKNLFQERNHSETVYMNTFLTCAK